MLMILYAEEKKLVEDKFLKLTDMEKFLDRADAEDAGLDDFDDEDGAGEDDEDEDDEEDFDVNCFLNHKTRKYCFC